MKTKALLAAIFTLYAASTAADQLRPEQTGETMPDGTVFAGYSPSAEAEEAFLWPEQDHPLERGLQPFYATAADAPGAYNWFGAAQYCADLQTAGHDNWRVPNLGELRALEINKDKGALAGTFNKDPDYFDKDTGLSQGWYWASSGGDDWAHQVHFGRGPAGYADKAEYDAGLVRCVRN